MYKTILVTLDGSKLAESILPHAEELARLFGSTVVLLEVLELPHLVGLPKGDIYDALPQMTPAESAAATCGRSCSVGITSPMNVSGSAKSSDQLAGMRAPNKMPRAVETCHSSHNARPAPRKNQWRVAGGVSGLL